MKKIIYVLLCVFLGLLLSFIAHAAIEIAYLVLAFKLGLFLPGYSGGHCFLPPLLTVGLAALGLSGGALLGFWWWDLVYIKKTRNQKNKKTNLVN